MAEVKTEEKISVIIKKPGSRTVEKKIGTSLKDYQDAVGGYIESIPMPGEDEIDIIVNDMGKLNGMEKTLSLPEYGDIICGPAVFVGVDDKSCTWRGLTDEEKVRVKDYIKRNTIPELVIDTDGDKSIICDASDEYKKFTSELEAWEKSKKTKQKIMEWIALHPGIQKEIAEFLEENGCNIKDI